MGITGNIQNIQNGFDLIFSWYESYRMIVEYDRRVVQQMLEFAYRYSTEILEEAKVYSNHTKHKRGIDIEDIKLAVSNHGDRASRAPPRTDLLHELARLKNNTPLPTIKPFSGPRIPPDRYCLSGVNFRAKEGSANSNSRNESFEDASSSHDQMDFDI